MKLWLGVLTAVSCIIAASQTQAQDSPTWSGYYLGGDLSISGGQDGEISATLNPGRDTRFTYVVAPEAQQFSRKRALPRKLSGGARFARLFDAGSFVWGLEGTVDYSLLKQSFDFGPFDAQPLQASGFLGSDTVPSDIGRSTDTLTARFKVDGTASARARIGVPLGYRLLVSAFVGPTLAKSSLSVRQSTSLLIQKCRNSPRPALCAASGGDQADFSSQSSQDDYLVGAVLGGAWDLRITDHWVAHGEASLSRYKALETTTGSAGGSSVSYRPEIYQISAGIVYRF